MKKYGIPRTPDVEYPDVADILRYGLRGVRNFIGERRRKARRFWKKREREQAKRDIRKELDEG